MKKPTLILFLVLYSFQFNLCIAQSGIINTITGNGVAGFSGDGGPAIVAEFNTTKGVAVDNYGNIYVADGLNNRIRKINTSGMISTFAGDSVNGYSGDGGPATAAELTDPWGIATDASGNLYIADGNACIRKVNTSGIISTIAGIGDTGGYSGDGGPATAAEISAYGVKIDKLGNVYIADTRNQVIRKVNTSGIINTIAGNGYTFGVGRSGGFSGDGGPATNAELYFPYDVAIDDSENVYIADYDNHRIRIVNTAGIINTFAGFGNGGYSGDGGPATSAELGAPTSIAVNNSNIYFVDNSNNRIRKVDSSGIISTFVGNGANVGIGDGGYSGDGGPATSAELSNPLGVALDTSGNLYIGDGGNERVRKVWMVLDVSAIVLSNVNCYIGDNGRATATVSEGTSPYTYSWLPNGGSNVIATGLTAGTYTIFVTDSNNIKGSAIVTITQPSLLSAFPNIVTNVNCNGGNNGSLSVNATGGTMPYTYLWNDANSQTTITATGLNAGNYTILVTDNNGCISSATTSISQPAAIVPGITEYAEIKCNGDSNAAVFSNALGGSGFYAYSWSDASSQATALATGLSAGNYTVTVTDNNGCTGTASASIIQPSPISIFADSINATVGNCNGSAWAIVSGGTFPYSYFWSGGFITDTITNQCTGNYCSIVTDANGCMDSVCVTINVSNGINNISNSPSINIYPDPNSGIFTLRLSSINEKCNVEIYNILGEEIYQAKTNSNNIEINLSGQSNGIYLYRVLKESGEFVGNGKVIIEK